MADEPEAPQQTQLPGPSEEERQLWQKQSQAADLSMSMAKDRQAQEAALAPHLYKQMGISVTKNSDGTYTTTEAAKTPEEQRRAQIQQLADERVIAGFKGELPVDPSVEADIKRSESQVDEELARRGIRPGSGDVYNRAKSEFLKGADSLRYSVRKGEMSSADAISSNRSLELLRKQGQYLDQARSGQNTGTAMVADASSLYNPVADRYGADRHKQAGLDESYNQRRMGYASDIAAGNNALTGAGIKAGTSIGAAFLMCWIAEELYGPQDVRTLMLRLWFHTAARVSWLGRLGAGLYRRIGRRTAWILHRVPVLKPPMRWLFNRVLLRAAQDLS